MSDQQAAAESVLLRAERLARATDEPLRLYRAHVGLGEIRRAQGRLAEALRHGRLALPLADRTANAKERALTRFSVARTLLELGRAGPARRLIAAAVELTRRSGDLLGQAWCLVASADAARIGGDPRAAAGAATEAVTLARRLRRPDAEAAAEQELAKALAATGDLVAARAAGGRAMRLCLEFDSPIERRYVLALLRELHRPAEAGGAHT
jgi:tetratricopeptide (TPR) repeat protein